MQSGVTRSIPSSLLRRAALGVALAVGLGAGSLHAQAAAAHVSCVQTDAVCKQDYAKLPADAQKAFDHTPESVKKTMAEKLTGKTFIGYKNLDHRKAFVEGHALGHDTFDFVGGRIDGMIAQGKMPASQGAPIHQFLDTARHMTPDQRDAYVDLTVRDSR